MTDQTTITAAITAAITDSMETGKMTRTEKTAKQLTQAQLTHRIEYHRAFKNLNLAKMYTDALSIRVEKGWK